MVKHKAEVALGSVLILGATLLFSLNSSAASETKTALIRVAATCTMDSSVTSAHTKSIPVGTYEEGIGNTLVSVACNDAGGFGVYAIGYTGDTDGNNKLVHGTNSSIQINTGTATSGENSQWAMKLTGATTGISATIENGYNNYSVVPNSYVKVASYPSATTTSNTAKFNTLYAAYINSTQAAGTYTGKVKYVLVHPSSESPASDDPVPESDPDPTLFRIYYGKNGGSGSMNYTTVAYGSTVQLATNTFTAPTGKAFDGWASSAAGAGPYYEDGSTFTAPSTSAGGSYTTLYAMWKNGGGNTPDLCTLHPENCPSPSPEPDPEDPDPTPSAPVGTTLQRAYEIAYTAQRKGMYEEDTPGSNTYHWVDSWNGASYEGNGRDVRFLMQDMTPEICASATAIDTTALVLDIRDQRSYYIAKTADGRCWMADNLATDPNDSYTKSHMNSSNTNASAAAVSNFLNNSVSTWLEDRYYTSMIVYAADKDYIATEQMDASAHAGGWKYGLLYSYCAATAGTYCADYEQGTETQGTAMDVSEDICPAGWRLPTGGYTPNDGGEAYGGEAYQLIDSYGSYNENQLEYMRSVLRIPFTGLVWEDYYYRETQSAYFWTSTIWGNSSAYRPVIRADGVFFPYGYDTRDNAYSVRCIAK